jgi:hypothetical protein
MAGLTLEALEKEFAQADAKDSESKRPPLTIRTIDEILAMEFDPADLILPNGYLVLGERTVMCGMGGVGKSRLTVQLALCCRTGRKFLGWETCGRELRWLFLQTENSCRRLQADLQRMMSAFTPAEREAINAGVFFHTLERDEDGFLALDMENRERITDAIAKTEANIVVFDPLRDFGIDDLNADVHMTETLREISRIIRRGNPRRVPLVIHHGLTGKTGIQKVIGFDRSSFGRNSKVLFMWTRAQINVAPVRPDDNSVLIIASGKSSNTTEFAPIAVRLNPDSLIYEVDADFDIESWREQITNTGKRRAALQPQMLGECLTKGREYDLKRLTAIVMEHFVVQKTCAYDLIRKAKGCGVLHYNKMIKTYVLV